MKDLYIVLYTHGYDFYGIKSFKTEAGAKKACTIAKAKGYSAEIIDAYELINKHYRSLDVPEYPINFDYYNAQVTDKDLNAIFPPEEVL